MARGLKTFEYSLRSKTADCKILLVDFKTLLKLTSGIGFLNDPKKGVSAATVLCEKSALERIKRLAKVVFNLWYADMIQESLICVPDVDGHNSGKT